MSALVERETIVLLNKADMRDGFFTITTTDPHAYKRIVRRLQGWDYKTKELGHESWQFTVPTAAASPVSLGVKKYRAKS